MKEYRVAISDDDEKTLLYICQQLTKAFDNIQIQLSIDSFTDNALLLQSVRSGEQYDIFFLDIEMPGLNGIEVSQRLRDTGIEKPLVFISNKAEFVFQSFEVRPFRFIRKSHFKDELPRLAKDLIREIHKNTGKKIFIEEDNSTNVYSFMIQDIIYIEVMGKYCNIVTNHQSARIRRTLDSIEAELIPFGFLKPHRSYLVNYRYIFSISKTSLILDNRMEIPLSRKRINEIKEQFMSLIRNRI
ncbi:MAG TPA: response regulator transcription factor [Clostridiales bacterium]|nr:response regulator transcription factor [Clostridiales bacterium]